MKVIIHKESIKQKEIIKTTFFLIIGCIYLLLKVAGLMGL